MSASSPAVAIAGAAPVPLPATRPMALEDPSMAWVIARGRVQVFAVRRAGAPAARVPLFSAQAGDLLMAPPPSAAVGLLAVGVEPDTSVSAVGVDALAAELGGPDADVVVGLVEAWLEALAAALAEPPPERGRSLTAGEETAIEAGASAWPATRAVWVPTGGALALFGERTRSAGADVLLPVPSQAWVQSAGTAAVTPLAGGDALAQPAAWAGIEAFHEGLLARLRSALERSATEAAARLERRRDYEDELRATTYAGLGAVLDGRRPLVVPGAESGELLAALRVVGDAQGIEIAEPPRGAAGATVDPVDAVARASGVRARKVALEGRWWRHDAGPFLAVRAQDGRPLAVVRRRRGYELIDCVEGTRTPVTEKVAATLAAEGHMLYRALPLHPLTGREVLRFMLRPIAGDLRWLAVFALGAAGVSLLVPIVTKHIFEQVVPGLQRSNLVWMSVLLVAFAVATFGFSLAQQLALLRVQGRASTDVQAAVWDRVLDLPLPFFRRYSSGSLTIRVMGIEQIQLLATETVVTAVLAIPIGVANLALAFALDARLGLFALLAIVFVAVAIALLVRYQVPRQRAVQEATTELFGVSMQLVDAVGKLRVADAEQRGFAEWGRRFGELKRRFYDAQLGFAAVTAFVVAAPSLGTLLLLVGALTLPTGALSGATFLAFNTAFIQALAAATGLAGVATFLAAAIPLYENTRPILAAERESEAVQNDPGELRGHIEVNHVSLRYADDAPLVLDDVGFTAEPGEFVALVGPSGAGKSSVLRVLLGFERPEVGTVRYDGQDLGSLDPRALRRQVGVVVQTASLMPGDIFTNIVGARPLTLEDAWAAAETAGIAREIEALPMGMHTFVSEGAGTFSGGQRQRLLIARAVAGRPRILLFDEATSALDGRTQAEVSQAIERLRATRIVIAHRLSTVRAADRILVIEAGRIVQRGTFDELMAVEGTFQRLATRQLA